MLSGFVCLVVCTTGITLLNLRKKATGKVPFALKKSEITFKFFTTSIFSTIYLSTL